PRRSRLHPSDADFRRRAHLNRRARARHRARRIRIRAQVCTGAQTVRQGNLRVSSDPVQTRRHGDATRRGAFAHLSRGLPEGSRAQGDERVFDGEALRLGDERQSLRGSDPDTRRLRLHQRLPARKILARLPTLHHRRRHKRDSTTRDRKAVVKSVSSATTSTDIERILVGEARAVARAISKVEDGAEDAAELMKAIYPHTGRGLVVGITGAPGAGKSSLVDRLAALYRKRG